MKSRTTALAALAAFALAGSAHAATISWSSSAFLTDGTTPWAFVEGQFATTGTQIFAENSGGGAVSSGGINFTAPSVGVFDADFNGYHSGLPVTLASTGTYKNANALGTVNLTGLTSGYTYRIQALLIDGRPDDGIQTITGRTAWFDGTNQGVFANGVTGVTWGDGLLATGTFVADATTQSFTIQTRNPADTANTGGQLNALTLYQTAVPEPSAALLGGLGLLALLRRRR
jgi:PEP-CTERM motif